MEIKGLLNTHMPCLNFEDVLIEPRVSNVFPEEADISTMMIAGVKANLPIISAHMSSVSSPELIAAISEMGGLGTVHEELDVDDVERYIARTKQFRMDKSKFPNAIATESGTPVIIAACSSYDIDKAEYLLAHADVNYVILNNVQPLHVKMVKNVKRLARKYPYKIIVGNIVTREGAEIYAKLPLAALKVGLGAGSICTTGIVSGCGMSQLTAIIEVSAIAKAKGMKVIADGGIKNGGDIAKALAAGADGVMIGKLFAGCDEAPGKVVELDGKRYKQYEGARYNTVEIPEQTGIEKIDRFLTTDRKNAHRVEGVSGLVPLIGPAHLLLYILSRSIKLSFGFVGAKTIEELQKRAIFRYVSANSHRELKSNIPFHTTEAFI
jgi:IMP dehydrogenase